MRKQLRTKLTVKRETVRDLSHDDLLEAAGGYSGTCHSISVPGCICVKETTLC